MEIFTKKEQCCGCSACYSICPVNAITMEYDEEGFLYPCVNNELCINCGKCKKVCAFQNGYNKQPVIEGYALKHKDMEVRKVSRSGGAFAGIAHLILSMNGVVYGAVYGDDFSVHHYRCEDKDTLHKIQGVKYIQSEMNDIFSQVKKDVESGRWVFFSGTSCQVAGLLSYLGNIDISKLYTADLVCHGVPNNIIWQKVLRWHENKYKGKITDAKFRDKEYGWKKHIDSVTINGKKHGTKRFVLMFYQDDIIRPSCYECKYTSLDRVADFTMGDYWGLKEQHKDFVDNKIGCSLFTINSQRGQDLFAKISDNFTLIKTDVVKATYSNPNLRKPTTKPKKREYFWDLYKKYDFDKVMKIYNRKIFVTRVKRKFLMVWYVTRDFVKKRM